MFLYIYFIILHICFIYCILKISKYIFKQIEKIYNNIKNKIKLLFLAWMNLGPWYWFEEIIIIYILFFIADKLTN